MSISEFDNLGFADYSFFDSYALDQDVEFRLIVEFKSWVISEISTFTSVGLKILIVSLV